MHSSCSSLLAAAGMSHNGQPEIHRSSIFWKMVIRVWFGQYCGWKPDQEHSRRGQYQAISSEQELFGTHTHSLSLFLDCCMSMLTMCFILCSFDQFWSILRMSFDLNLTRSYTPNDSILYSKRSQRPNANGSYQILNGHGRHVHVVIRYVYQNSYEEDWRRSNAGI